MHTSVEKIIFLKVSDLDVIDKHTFFSSRQNNSSALFKENNSQTKKEKKRFVITNSRKGVPCLPLKKKKKFQFYTNKLQDFRYQNIYVQHFFSMFLKQGRRFYIEWLYKKFLLIHKDELLHTIFNIYYIMWSLQFFLLLKGYRYKVGRGVVKHNYFLVPIDSVRQYYLSFFFFRRGIKTNKRRSFFDQVNIEFFNLIYFEYNRASVIVEALYELAYQSRMFTPRPKYSRKVTYTERGQRKKFLFRFASQILNQCRYYFFMYHRRKKINIFFEKKSVTFRIKKRLKKHWLYIYKFCVCFFKNKRFKLKNEPLINRNLRVLLAFYKRYEKIRARNKNSNKDNKNKKKHTFKKLFVVRTRRKKKKIIFKANRLFQ